MITTQKFNNTHISRFALRCIKIKSTEDLSVNRNRRQQPNMGTSRRTSCSISHSPDISGDLLCPNSVKQVKKRRKSKWCPLIRHESHIQICEESYVALRINCEYWLFVLSASRAEKKFPGRVVDEKLVCLKRLCWGTPRHEHRAAGLWFLWLQRVLHTRLRLWHTR